MDFVFRNLDEVTRKIMLKDFENDYNQNKWYISNRLSKIGIKEFPDLLRNSFKNGTIETLENSRIPYIHLNFQETYTKSFGFVGIRNMPANAPKILAGEFNRYYMIALCKRAIQEHKRTRLKG